ncbi:MAG: type II toxin-antitoxin system prevent-host-death family antitoxin [Spirochaetes bacterium]|nr:type II toxin-antitoxin system prevent-host-death family antitoxin [Spirochaetota bacterium]MBU0953897.1 type II toxin-antitoxin system prevent-host-death family antitoxin [Spirochaetota bacterium]
MPTIRPSADLRNKYNEISAFCHQYPEPVFITKNGQGDLAVMSIETYENLAGRMQLYKLLDEGLEQEQNGEVQDFTSALSNIKNKIKL